VIVGKTNQHQVRQVAGLFKLLQFFDELRRPEHVRHGHVPTDSIGGEIRAQRFNGGITIHFDGVGTVNKLTVMV
jgi:hypothetical protein